MKALCWNGKHQIAVQEVPDPRIEHPRDAIIRITSTAICGSDLHLYDGLVQTMQKGDVLGHEPMGEVIEVGPAVTNLKVGDRVVVPFTISCGDCLFCKQTLYSLCDNSNPNREITEKVYGSAPAGLFGYSHMFGGYAGGQAQYLRVPFADVGPIKIPENLRDEQVLFLSDIFPTGYMAAENCNIQPGDIVAVWGAGPVGQFAIRSAFLLGAGRVIVIDNIAERLEMATQAGAEIINFQNDEDDNLFDQLKSMTGGYGPNSCIDAVGMEAHGTDPGMIYDWIKMGLRLATDRPNVLRQAIQACRKGGTVSVPGVYAGFLDKMPFGAAFNKGLTFKMGQTHVQRYTQPLLNLISNGKIDPSFIITHQLPLESAPEAYETFKQKEDGCIKVVLKPWETQTAGKVRHSANEHKPDAPSPSPVAASPAA
jgi:threonine dehydrogenase-like Zn-dependent dehydrogenase